MIQVAVIGAGFAGSTHARAYARIPETRVAFVVDQDQARADRLAREVGAVAAANADQALSDPSVDLVDVALPTPFHTEAVTAALGAGKHVVVEKPLALTLAEVDAMLAARAHSGKYLMVGHVLRFWPEYVAMRELLASGRLGRPLAASALRLSNMPQWSAWFRDPRASGGAVLDLQIHDLDMLNWLFGRPERIYAQGVQDASGGWNHVASQVRYPALSASVETSFMMPADYPFTVGFRVVCEQGVVEYRFRAGGAGFESGEPAHSLLLHEPGAPNQPLPCEPADAFEREIVYFVRCVRENVAPEVVTPQAARLAVQTCLAARDSLETGRPVDL